jgi:hypothetical protein
MKPTVKSEEENICLTQFLLKITCNKEMLYRSFCFILL